MELSAILASVIVLVITGASLVIQFEDQFSGFATAGGKPDFYFKDVSPNFYENKADINVCAFVKSAKEVGLKELPIVIEIKDPENPANSKIINAQPQKPKKGIAPDLAGSKGSCVQYPYTLSQDDMTFYDSIKPAEIRFVLDRENLAEESNEDNNEAVFECAGRLCLPKTDEFKSVTIANPAKYGKYIIYPKNIFEKIHKGKKQYHVNVQIADENKKPIKLLTIQEGDKSPWSMFNNGDGLFLQLEAVDRLKSPPEINIKITSTKPSQPISEIVTGGGSGVGVTGSSPQIPINHYIKSSNRYSEDRGATGFSFSATVCSKDANSAKDLGLDELPAIISVVDKNLKEGARIINLKSLSQIEINNKKAFLVKNVNDNVERRGKEDQFQIYAEGLNKNADVLLNLKGNNKENCVTLTYRFGNNINPEIMESYRSSKEVYFVLDPHNQISKDSANKVLYCKDAKCSIIPRYFVDAGLFGEAPIPTLSQKCEWRSKCDHTGWTCNSVSDPYTKCLPMPNTVLPSKPTKACAFNIKEKACKEAVGGGGSGVEITGPPLQLPPTVTGDSIITTIAGTGVEGFRDGAATIDAKFHGPNVIATDKDGNVYNYDTVNGAIRKISSGNVQTVAGSGKLGFSGDGGKATDAKFNTVEGLASDLQGNIYIADQQNHRIRKLTPNAIGGYTISTVAGKPRPHPTQVNLWLGGFSGDGGLATEAELYWPTEVVVDSSNNVYFADSANHRIRKIDITTGKISTIAGSSTEKDTYGVLKGGFSGDGGKATDALLSAPWEITIDSKDNIYIFDFRNSRIRKIFAKDFDTDNNGKIDSGSGAGGVDYKKDHIYTIAGNGQYGFSGDGGSATSAQFKVIAGMAVDNEGNVYLADRNNQRIRKLTPDNKGVYTISTIAGSSTEKDRYGNSKGGYSGDGGSAKSALLNSPQGIATDKSNNLYIADFGNHRIRKISATIIAIPTPEIKPTPPAGGEIQINMPFDKLVYFDFSEDVTKNYEDNWDVGLRYFKSFDDRDEFREYANFTGRDGVSDVYANRNTLTKNFDSVTFSDCESGLKNLGKYSRRNIGISIYAPEHNVCIKTAEGGIVKIGIKQTTANKIYLKWEYLSKTPQ